MLGSFRSLNREFPRAAARLGPALWRQFICQKFLLLWAVIFAIGFGGSLAQAQGLSRRPVAGPNPLRSATGNSATTIGPVRAHVVSGEEEFAQTSVPLPAAPEELPPALGSAAPRPLAADVGDPLVWPLAPQAPRRQLSAQWPEEAQPGSEADLRPLPYSNYSPQLIHPVSWFQPLGGHTSRNDPERALGWGEPLRGTSWRNRPIYAGLFAGGIFNDDLIANRVLQNNASLLGFRFGWDFDHYWGTEFRYAYARPNLTKVDRSSLGQANDYYSDLSLLYYPFGDSRWRPYALIGLGIGTFRFYDEADRKVDDTLLTMPLGLGLKYFATPQFSLRVDFVDNLAFGSNAIGTMNNFSIMGGAEWRFGGRRTLYTPWHGANSD